MFIDQSGGGQWTLPQFSYFISFVVMKNCHIVGYNVRDSNLRCVSNKSSVVFTYMEHSKVLACRQRIGQTQVEGRYDFW
jgi:hypothetical protein